MTPRRRPTTTAAGRGPALVAPLLAATLGLPALVEALRSREPLGEVLGAGWPILLGALLLCVGLPLLAAWRAARAEAVHPRSSVAPLRLLLELCGLAVLAVVFVLQPPSARVLAGLLTLAGGLTGLTLLLRPWLLRAVPRAALSAADLLLLALVAVPLGGELVLRAVAALHPTPLLAPRRADAAAFLTGFAQPPGSLHLGFPLDARGNVDEPPESLAEGERLVVCVGDSFSVGVVPHAFHFTTVAEQGLPGTRIYNMGVVGIGPDEYLQLVREQALPLHPAAVVIDLFVGNDVSAVREEQAGSLPVLERDRWLLAVVLDRLGALETEHAAQPREPPAAEVGLPRTDDPAELVRLLPWLVDVDAEWPSFSEPGYRRIEARRAGGACGPDTRPYAALFAVLARIRRACGAVPLAVLLIPDEFQVEDGIWRQVLDERDGAPLDRDQPQRLIGAWLAEQSIPCLDLLPVLRAVPPLDDGDRHLYHRRDTHFNARGNRVVGEALAAFLAESLP